MNATVYDSNCFFVKRALAFLAFTIVAMFGENFSYPNATVTAFSNSHINCFCGRHHSITSLSADRGNNINDDYVSKLEEEFHKSGDNDRSHPRKAFRTPVTTHTNFIDLLDQIDNAPANDLTIVLFFAHYCKTCQRAFAPYKQLANDATEGVTFCRLETSSLTPKQFRSLGIDRVPFLQIYRNGICVASFSATQTISPTSSKIVLKQRLLEQIDACQRRTLQQWSTFRDQHDNEIEANKLARRRIRENPGHDDDDVDDDSERLYRSVRTVTSEAEFLQLLDQTEDMVAIMVHSHFDPSCRRAQHKFRKIASERQQQQKEQCTFARIEASVLSDRTLPSLGIQNYPHIQIYRASPTCKTKRCVASFSIPKSFLFARLLHESLDAIDKRTPEEWIAFYKRHRHEIESQQLALEGIRREREQH